MEIILFIAGSIFAIIGGYLLRDEHQFRRSAQACQGEVVGYQVRNSSSRNSRGAQTYAPVVSYQHQGQQHQFTAAVSTNRTPYAIGASIPILVSPTDPSQARLNNKVRGTLAFVFLLIGLTLVVAFFFVFNFSPISVIIALFVIGALLVQAIMTLRRHNIHYIEELKQRWQQIKKQGFNNISYKNISNTEQQTIITNPLELTEVKNANRIPKFLLILFLIIGIGLCSGGVIYANKRAEFLHTALSSQGTVISLKSETSHSDGKTTVVYYPVVRYTPPGKSTSITFKHNIGSSHPSFSRGDIVQVLYVPNDPHNAIIDQGWLNWLVPIIMIGIGGVFCLVSGLTFWKQKQVAARANDVKKTGPKLEI
jgi:uncharacterized protein YxeA